MRSRDNLIRAIALSATVLVIVGQLAEILHFIAVEHRVCPLHGKTVGVYAGDSHADIFRERSEWIAAFPPTLNLHGTECELVANTHQQTLSTFADAHIEVIGTLVHVVVLADSCEVLSQRAILRFAPKTSPPSVRAPLAV